VRDETLIRLREMVASEEPQNEVWPSLEPSSDTDGANIYLLFNQIISFLQEQSQSGLIPDVDFIALVWHGLMDRLDMGSRPDQIVDMVVRAVVVSISFIQ
jgi:hypothetical protein